MSLKKLAALASAIILIAGFAQAQTTGEIYGKATDKSGAVVPGVTVTLTSPALLQPQVAVTSSTGVYSFPRIPIGEYTVKFELAGFTTVVRDGIRIVIGQNAQINGALDVSSKQEVITVTGEAPLIDTRNNTRASNFNQEALQNIPSARDPWVILQQSAGIAMDRENIGGNQSGQQSAFIARGAAGGQVKWNLDGVDITDMAALSSPVYYDFDAFEEMQIATGGADVTMQTAGVGINLVTKSGSDKFKGSARYYITDDKFQATNVTDALRAQGASSGNPIQNIKDFGFEVGGPIVKGKLWAWGSWGKQDIKVGVNNFFLKSNGCDALTSANASSKPFDLVKSCLNTDLTTLDTYNLKLSYQLSKSNQLALFANKAAKLRNARGADDLHPIDSTNRQKGVEDPALGSSLWKTGVPKTYKASLRHVFSSRFLMEFQYSHVGNNFVLDFHEDALKTVQPSVEIVTNAFDRSFNASQFVRPTNSFDITGTRSASGFMGGDHAIKFGIRHRQDRAISTNHRGGNIEARWQDANGDRIFQSSEAIQANIYRDSYTDYNVFGQSAYLQDTFTRGKLTVQAGLRFDRQWDRANKSVVPATPFFGQTTRTGLVFNQLPGVTFEGADPGVTFNNLAPRLGVNWDVKGDGHSVLKLNYARYYSQLGDGDLAGTLNPVGAVVVRYPWTDLNGDKFVQPNEVNISAQPLAFTTGYDPANPAALKTSGTVDPNLRNEKTDEYILGFDKQFGNSFAVSVAGIYRAYRDFRRNDTIGLTAANYAPVSFTPAATACPVAGSQCQTVTYYQATTNQANFPNFVYTNATNEEYRKNYKGIELTARKKVKSLTVNASYTWNDTPIFTTLSGLGTFGEDPSNVANLNGGQFAPQSAGSGIDNIFTNAKWLFKLQAAYTLPWQQIGIATAFNARSGYPLPTAVVGPTRATGGGQATIYLAPLGDSRLQNFSNADLRLDKGFKLHGTAKITASVDVFNALNSDTILSKRRTQNATNANQISALVAPRVIRFGARLNW